MDEEGILAALMPERRDLVDLKTLPWSTKTRVVGSVGDRMLVAINRFVDAVSAWVPCARYGITAQRRRPMSRIRVRQAGLHRLRRHRAARSRMGVVVRHAPDRAAALPGVGTGGPAKYSRRSSAGVTIARR